MKRLLCIWLPDWPIQRFRNPRLLAGDGGEPEPPLVLWRDDPRRGHIVAARCDRAAAWGVRFGMPVVEAAELLGLGKDRSPTRSPRKDTSAPRPASPRIEPHDELPDREALLRLAELVQAEVCPRVAIESLDARPWAGKPLAQPDALWGDLQGVTHLFGGELGLLRATRRLLARLGLTARLAIADTPGAAWAFANYRPLGVTAESPRDRLADPDHDRSLVVPLGRTAERLGPLPVEALRIDVATAATLHRLGIETIAELAQLPRDGLAMRLGQPLVRRLAQALGEVDEPLTFHHAPAENRHTIDLEYATEDPAILTDRLLELVRRSCVQLSESQRGALRLACRLQVESHPAVDIELGLFAPTLDADHLGQLLTGAFEAKRLPGPVTRLTLAVTLSGPLRRHQESLFPGPPGGGQGETWDRGGKVVLGRLIDALSGRLGRDRVLGVRLRHDPLPEASFETFPLTGQPPKRKRRRLPQTSPGTREATADSTDRPSPTDSVRDGSASMHDAPSPADALRRPLVLLTKPLPLSVVEPAHAPDGCPARFRIGGRVHRILRAWGPERIETGWWQGPTVRRDYFRVQTDHGQCWWIFRDLVLADRRPSSRRHDWRLHGRFA